MCLEAILNVLIYITISIFCVSDIPCPIPLPPPNGDVMFTPSEMDYIIDVIYSCDAGYLAVGETVQSCLEIGYWTAPPPRCYSMYAITLLLHCYISHTLLNYPNASCALQQQKQCRFAWKYDTTCRECHLPIAIQCAYTTLLIH